MGEMPLLFLSILFIHADHQPSLAAVAAVNQLNEGAALPAKGIYLESAHHTRLVVPSSVSSVVKISAK